MWFLILLVLAVIAYFIIKAMTGKSASTDSPPAELSAGTTNSGNPAISSSAANPVAADAADTDSTGSDVANGASAAVLASAAAGSLSATDLPDLSVQSDNVGQDVREMIKMLNLAAPDAGRLGVTKELFAALRSGDNSVAASDDELASVASKLREMLV